MADTERPKFTKPTVEQLGHRFKHHPPQGDQAERYTKVRSLIFALAAECVQLTPCSPEQSLALNSLDMAMFQFNAASARHG